MEMQAYEIDIPALADQFNKFVKLMLGYSEFIFIQSGRNIFMGMGIDVRIDPDRDIGNHAIFPCHLVDDEDLLKGLTVECLYAQAHCIADFLIAFPDSRIDNPVSWEPALMGMQDFISTDAISSKSLCTDFSEDPLIGVGLHGIVYSEIMSISQLMDFRNRSAKQIHVVVIKRSGYLFKTFNCI